MLAFIDFLHFLFLNQNRLKIYLLEKLKSRKDEITEKKMELRKDGITEFF